MEEKHDFKIIIIDDSLDIHKDFLKILTAEKHAEIHQELINAFVELDKNASSISKMHSADKNIALPKFKIDAATQGKEGFEKISNAYQEGHPYALAFVDIRMPPGWDGVETIKKIWSVDENIQIVICTAYSDYTWEETVAHLGKNDSFLILKKPFDHIAVRQLD